MPLSYLIPSWGRAGLRCPRYVLNIFLGLLPLLLSIPIHTLQADDAAATRQLVANECAQCHGMDGNSKASIFPKIAGLQHDYLLKQMIELANGARQSATMTPVMNELTRAEFDDLADYFSRQKRTAETPSRLALLPIGRRIYQQGNAARGVPACAGCHKPDGSGTSRSPALAGQNAAYILQQLQAFKNGSRDNDRGQLMRTTINRLTEEEMIAVAEYVSGMSLSQSGLE